MEPTQLHQLGRTLQEVCPEDFPQPVYVLDKRDILAALWPGDAWGFAQAGLDLHCQPILERQAVWQGRGYCIGVDVAAHSSEEHITATALHEFGHLLRQPAPKPFTLKEEALCRQCGWDSRTERLIDFLTRFEPAEPEPVRPVWTSHDVPFVRALLHVWARWPDPVWLPLTNHSGGLCTFTSVWSYQLRLQEELQDFPSGSIRGLLELPAPAEFVRLFERDCQRITENQHLAGL
jgi:hypothetical protein